MTRDRRRAAFRLGMAAETKAAWLLRLKGYRILAFRFKAPGGEIDLIALKAGTLAFVEVKARGRLEAALEAITPAQRRRIATAARIWLSRNPAHMPLVQRFDAVFVVPWRLPAHHRNAFEINLH